MVVDRTPCARQGSVRQLPFHFSGCDTTIRTPAPLLGQRNGEIAKALDTPRCKSNDHRRSVFYAEEVIEKQEPTPHDVFPGRLWPPPSCHRK